MKRFFCLLAAIVLLGSALPAQSLSHTVSFAYMEACETGNGPCAPMTLERRTMKQKVMLIMPSGGTVSSVMLLDQAAFPCGFSSKDQPEPLRHDQTMANRSPRLDLTGLPDGDYLVRMVSCAVGGSFQLHLRTRPQP